MVYRTTDKESQVCLRETRKDVFSRVIGSVLAEGVEIGYFEAKRTETFVSLERKIRALPIVVPKRCVGARRPRRASAGLDNAYLCFPTLLRKVGRGCRLRSRWVEPKSSVAGSEGLPRKFALPRIPTRALCFQWLGYQQASLDSWVPCAQEGQILGHLRPRLIAVAKV